MRLAVPSKWISALLGFTFISIQTSFAADNPTASLDSLVKDVKYQASYHLRDADNPVSIEGTTLRISSEIRYSDDNTVFVMLYDISGDMTYVRRSLKKSSIPIDRVVFDVQIKGEDRYGNPLNLKFGSLAWDRPTIDKINENADRLIYARFVNLTDIQLEFRAALNKHCIGKWREMSPEICIKSH